MDKGKNERSQYFLGKLKKTHNSRVFTGWSYQPEVRKPLVGVVYEHDRNQSDRKMEVGLPKEGEEEDLMHNFSDIRHEGSQNHSSCPSVTFYHQKQDDPELMASEASLAAFRVDGVQLVNVVSSKNFQLIYSPAFRKQYRTAPAAVTDAPPGTTDAAAAPVAVDGTKVDDSALIDYEKVYLQFGKLDDDVFSLVYSAPFTLLQAFMVALSRFETQQKY
jgi:hypothetical protein